MSRLAGQTGANPPGCTPKSYAPLSEYERVEILCHDATVSPQCSYALDAARREGGSYLLHTVSNDRVWLRDSAPTGVIRSDGGVELLNWRSTAGQSMTTIRRTPK